MKKTLELIREFNSVRDWGEFHSPSNLAKSISIESAELLECFQWSEDFDIDKVEEELADVLIYCLQLADRVDLDPIEIMMKKIIKNGKKYPVDKSRGSSKKYDEL